MSTELLTKLYGADEQEEIARRAREWRLHQARELLTSLGWVEQPDGSFKKPEPSPCQS
jgi:hypothetical protein